MATLYLEAEELAELKQEIQKAKASPTLKR